MNDDSRETGYYNIEDSQTFADEGLQQDASNLYSLEDAASADAADAAQEAAGGAEDEPLYALPDDEPEALNPATLDFERENTGSPFLSLLRIMFSPVEGWKAFKRHGYTTGRIGAACFFPLAALAAAASLLQFFYGAMLDIRQSVVTAIVMFISFFFGYFTVVLLMDLVLPRKSAEIFRSTLGKNFVMMSMSTLALFELVYQALPMIDPVLAFLPVWTLYLICRGIKIMRVPVREEKRTMWTMCLLIIGMPSLCRWIFSELFTAG